MQINGINNVHGPQSISQPHRAAAAQPTQSAPTGDSIEISSEATLLSRINDIPDVRADRVADIKSQIADGTYETNAKLDLAVSRLLDELV